MVVGGGVRGKARHKTSKQRSYESLWISFSPMKRRGVANLFDLLLAAFTRAAVGFGVLHCKLVQRFLPFRSSLGVALSCSEQNMQ